ncbi:DUF262 domain-containing protein [Helicobacter pylori]
MFFSYECYKDSDYFCGSLVLITIDTDSTTDAETYDIVDGQQRLSTFILLAKVLVTLYHNLSKTSRDFLEKSLGDTDGEKRKRLDFNTMGSNAKKDFQYALKFFDDLDASNGKDSTKVKNNYLKNAICLKNYLEKKEIEDINAFIKWLYHKVRFIKTICPNISMALRIFSVLNARGLPLHAIDVFKVELLKKLAKEKDQEEFVSRWNGLYQKCLEEGFVMETLFNQYLNYLNPVTSKKKTNKRLDTQFDKLQKSPLKYLDGVEDFHNAYVEVLEMPDRYAHLLSYKEDNYWRVILCASLLHGYSKSEIEALKELLFKFYYKHWVANTPKDRIEQTCCNMITALKEKESMEHIVSIARKNLDDNSATQRFQESLKDSHVYTNQSTKNPWLKPILILVEYFMSDDDCPKRIQMDKNLHVEHILPKKPDLSSQWAKDFSEEERELYTHSLANLTLLGGKRNIEASNFDFKDKKKIYMGEEIRLNKKKPFEMMTCYNITKDIAYHLR